MSLMSCLFSGHQWRITTAVRTAHMQIDVDVQRAEMVCAV